MDITPPASDKGVQRLKLENEDKTVKQTGQIASYPRIESDEEHHEPKPPVTLERRNKRRRYRDRRRLEVKTRFDTRSHDERRTQLRRESDQRTGAAEGEADADGAPPTGIDELA
jgi:hypothetical protein